MKNLITQYLKEFEYGKPQVYENLSMVPLMISNQPELDVMLLADALKREKVEVTEVSEDGSVPFLQVVNRAKKHVLILDGEELVGAKQNRIVNVTILLRPQSKTIIPVSCVEQGRWSYASRRFSASDTHLFATARKRKHAAVHQSLRTSGVAQSDQSEIWTDIEEASLKLDAPSPTGAMKDIYRHHRRSLNGYRKALPPADGQAGAIFALDGRIVGCDILCSPKVFAKKYDSLLSSYALDALWRKDKGRIEKSLTTPQAKRWLSGLKTSKIETFPSVGEGLDLRFEGKKLNGAALVWEDRVIHLSAFPGD